MVIKAQSPCRVDLAGGTLDIWPLYLHHANAVTVNFAVNRYTYAEVRTREDARIVLRSRDQKAEETFESLTALASARKYRLPLLAHVVKFFAPQAGVEIETDSESPAGAGISGSSSLMITLSSALNKLTGRGYPIETIRQIAQNVEAQIIRVPTGCQDYYPAMYGGVSAIDLTPAGILHNAVQVDLEDFNRRIVLAYTGEPRNSGINNWEVTKAHINGDKAVHKNFDRIAEIAHGMRGAIGRAAWDEVGALLRDEWSHRKKNAPGISTPLIDNLVTVTRKAGALGAKVCGAGGGGCVFMLVKPEAKDKVSRIVRESGAELLDVSVAPKGVRVQTSK